MLEEIAQQFLALTFTREVLQFSRPDGAFNAGKPK